MGQSRARRKRNHVQRIKQRQLDAQSLAGNWLTPEQRQKVAERCVRELLGNRKLKPREIATLTRALAMCDRNDIARLGESLDVNITASGPVPGDFAEALAGSRRAIAEGVNGANGN